MNMYNRKHERITDEDRKSLLLIIGSIATSMQELYKLTIKLYDWVDNCEFRKQYVISAYMKNTNLSERQAIGKVDMLLRFGSGELSDELFGLPVKTLSRIMDFTKENLDKIIDDPKVKLVTVGDNNRVDIKVVDYRDLSDTEFGQVFTDGGTQREPDVQKDRLTRQESEKNKRFVNNTVHIKRGYKSAPVLLEILLSLALRITDKKKMDTLIVKMSSALKKIKNHRESLD